MTQIVKSFHRSIILMFICAVLVVMVVSYYTISGIINEQGKRQQESIIPFFSLISKQILKPLYISQTMANDRLLLDLVDAERADNDKLLRYLQRIEQQLGLKTFIAMEKSRIQINSDGTLFELNKQDVHWYFAIKDQPGEQFALIGKTGDPHLYVDLRLRNEAGEFIGFIGIGIRLTDFIDLFEQYKQHFGYDFVFVDEHGEIMLSSDKQLMSRANSVSEPSQTQIESFEWYQLYRDHVAERQSVIGSAVIEIDDEDVLVSKIRLSEFDWELYVLSPLSANQQAIRFVYIRNIVLLITVLIVLFALVSWVVRWYDQAMVKRSETDFLTGLANRQYVEWISEKLQKEFDNITVLLCDIDHFKAVNDQYGHDVGDEVIRQVSNQLTKGMREHDVVARWGGEEFIILLPGAGLNMAKMIGERIRLSVCNSGISSNNSRLQVSISIGLAEMPSGQSLNDTIKQADLALYEAKKNGRNRLECYYMGEQ